MDNKEITQKSYSTIAEEYYEVYNDDQTDLSYIDEFLEKCHSKILDLGCGIGQYSRYMKNKGFQVCGVDFAQEMIKLARLKDNSINYIEADICDLPENMEKDFDGVLIAFVIQHLSKKETQKVLEDLHKYTTKECNLLIFFRSGERILKESEPFNPKFEYTIKEYTKSEISDLLDECGYEVLKIEEKPQTEDEYSLCPTTMVLYAKKK